MISEYGRKDCKHEWRYCPDWYVEECIPAVCIKCGALGCVCDADNSRGGYENRLPREIFFGEQQNKDANINGRWINPYVKGDGDFDLSKYYIIENITDLDGNTRTDGRYPQRIGRRFKFCMEPQIGSCMYLEYCPRDGEQYMGVLKTSVVQASQLTITGGEVVTTLNSIYYLEPEVNEKFE